MPRLLNRAHRERIDAYKLVTGCADCGYADHPAALQLDHPPDADKDRRYGGKAVHPNWSWARIQAVLDACDVVCANCHAIRTATRGYLGGRGRRVVTGVR